MNIHIDDVTFKKLVQQSLVEIPSEFKEKLENVSIVVQDFPSRYQISRLKERGETGLLLGLYEGVPKTKRAYYGIGGQLPDKITIFKNSIFAISSSYEDVMKNIKETVIHEIAHHFGISDQKITDIKNN